MYGEAEGEQRQHRPRPDHRPPGGASWFGCGFRLGSSGEQELLAHGPSINAGVNAGAVSALGRRLAKRLQAHGRLSLMSVTAGSTPGGPAGGPAGGSAGGAPGLTLRDPRNLVSPRAKRYWMARAAVPWLVFVGAQVAYLVSVPGSRSTRVAVLMASVAMAAVHVTVMPQWRYRVHRWEASDTAVYTQSGWLSQQRRIAPLSRIQTVDTARGPIEQLFKLASITVTTASAKGPLKIEGLDRTTADRLVHDLTTATERAPGDAT